MLKGHQAPVTAIAISSDGQTLASGSEDKTVSLWDLKTGKHDFTFFGQAKEVFAVAISRSTTGVPIFTSASAACLITSTSG